MAQNKKRVFKRRSGNKVFFTFHSYGSVYRFAPFDFITDDRVLNEVGQFESMSQLDFYKNEVRMAGLPHVYILDNKGERVAV